MRDTRWLASLTLLGLGLLIWGTWHVQSRIETETRKTLGDSLTTVLQSTRHALHDWAEDNIGEAQIWAGSDATRRHTQALLATDRSARALLSNPAQAGMRRLLDHVMRERDYKGLFIIARDGTNLASMRDRNVGAPSLLLAQDKFLEKIWAGRPVMSLPLVSDVPLRDASGKLVDGRPTMFVGAPIRDADRRVIAAFTFRIDPLAQFDDIFRQGRLGLSGETYAFDKTGTLISESRFDHQLEAIGLVPNGVPSVLNLKILDPGVNLVEGETPDAARADLPFTVMARHALGGEAGIDLDGYRDYRGVGVVGAWLWDTELDLGLVTETDTAEAYTAMNVANRFLTGAALVAAIFLIGLAVLAQLSRMRLQRESDRVRAAEERSRIILDAVGEGVVGVDTDGRVTFMNPASTRMLGYTQDELIGTQVYDLVRLRDGSRLPPDQCILHQMFADGASLHGLGDSLQPKTGACIPVESSAELIRKKGEVVGAVITFTDISEREEAVRRLRESEQRFALALEGASAGVFDWNLVNDEVFFSPEYKRMLGYDAAQPDETLRVRHCVHPDEYQRAYDEIERFLAGADENYDTEFRLRHKDGHYRNILSKGYAFRDADGVATRMIGVSSDVTWRKQTEAELREAKREAELANTAKSAFLSSMSHELRTPMNAILGFSQLLEFDKNEPLTETQAEFVHQIRGAGDHLLGLIDEVLDLSKIEAGKVALSIEEVRADDLIREALALIEPLSRPRDITIIDDTSDLEGVLILVDYSRCKQVLLNLLSNAVKYNREAGRVTVSSEVIDGTLLRISVNDTGKGIPEDKRDQLFQPFSRLGAESTDIEGTGIGLTITRKLVELQGGKIGFHSESGVGSTFWVDWILGDGTPSDRTRDTGAPADGHLDTRHPEGASVLYIEDNPANIKLVENIVGQIPALTLLCAHNAEFGLKLAEHMKPGVVLMDINLPGLNGFEALEILKSKDGTRDIPVIALTAEAMPRDVERGLDAGFHAYLTKPLDVALLLRTIVEALGQRHAAGGLDGGGETMSRGQPSIG